MANSRPTKLITLGRNPGREDGIENTPVTRVSAVRFKDLSQLRARQKNWDNFERDQLLYGSVSTPIQYDLEKVISELEGAEATFIFPSGLGAIAGTLLSLCSPGDEILAVDCCYSAARHLLEKELPRLDLKTHFFDPTLPKNLEILINDHSKILYLELPGSVTFELYELEPLIAIAKQANLKIIVDNSWASSLHFQPLAFGVDVSLHSLSKVANGHSDILLGSISGMRDIIHSIRRSSGFLGYRPSPDDCALALRGIRTLECRTAKYFSTSLNIANWLKQQPSVVRVFHPALPSAQGPNLWSRYFSGGSGLFSFVIKYASQIAIDEFFNGFEVFSLGYSWGSFHSQILPVTAPERLNIEFPPDKFMFVRLFCGLEQEQDLIMDLELAFFRAKNCDAKRL